MNKPSYQELEKRILELEEESLQRERIEAELLKKQAVLRAQNISVVRKSIELSDIKRELEDKNYDLELSRSDLEEAMGALRKARDELELRVEERTRELAKANEGLQTEISERKRAEEEKKELEGKLLQAQKLEAIGTLAGGIAHDFNNLLMGIQGNVSLMLMHIDSTHRHYERLNKIEKRVQSCARLTSQLLGYARKGKYEIKSINLNKLAQETCETFGRTKKEITIHRELEEHLFSIEADQGQIQQVLLNLFINAADAMPGGGDLILKTTNTTHNDMKGKLYEPKPGNYVLLTVTDTGIGMDKETVERIFDPFFTTKEMGRGTGLGLASTYGIVKSHGGYIDVESKKGHGTTFSIYLPL